MGSRLWLQLYKIQIYSSLRKRIYSLFVVTEVDTRRVI